MLNRAPEEHGEGLSHHSVCDAGGLIYRGSYIVSSQTLGSQHFRNPLNWFDAGVEIRLTYTPLIFWLVKNENLSL